MSPYTPTQPAVLQVGVLWAVLRCRCTKRLLVAHADGVTRCDCGRGWRFVPGQVEEVGADG